jgi:hypothetical protein
MHAIETLAASTQKAAEIPNDNDTLLPSNGIMQSYVSLNALFESVTLRR